MSENENETLYEEVKRLYLVDKKRPQEICAELAGRATLTTVRAYVAQITKKAKADGTELPLRVKGGFRPFLERAPLDAMHRTIGARLNNHRVLKLNMSTKEFCQQYRFLNPHKLRQVELGVHPIELREVMRIAEIIGTPMVALMEVPKSQM